jgi:hypothetical protein
MISETCKCGAQFQAERPKDELKLLNQWRLNHSCPGFAGGGLAIVDTSRNESSSPIGFMATGLVDPARSPYEPDWDD